MKQQQAIARRNVLDIDTRRTVATIARGRKAADVAREGHESFIVNLLCDRMGWPKPPMGKVKQDPTPQVIKDAAKQMAAFLVQRDKEEAVKAAAKKAADAVEAAKD